MSPRRKPRIIYNDDTCSLRFLKPPHTEKKLRAAMNYLRDTQVDCLCWCLYAGDIAYSWPSKVCETYYDNCARAHVPNKFRTSTNLMLSLHQKGIDYLPLLIDWSRKSGIQFFGSFRMNDSHQKSMPTGVLASDFWRQHQEYRLWEVTDGKTYYNATLDYSFPEVRRRKHDAIVEVAEAYDMDGIELDFVRNPYTFQPSEAWSKRGILTRFIKGIREALNTIGRKRGRPIGLMIRVPTHEEKLVRAGMDVKTWLRRGYLDALVMSHHTNNLDVDVAPWAEVCHEHGVLFYGSTECGAADNAPAHNHVVPETVEETVLRQRAMADNFLATRLAGRSFRFE